MSNPSFSRRGFLALASGLLIPVPEPVRAYSFAPVGGWPLGQTIVPPAGWSRLSHEVAYGVICDAWIRHTPDGVLVAEVSLRGTIH